jgi:hypothetical protein
MPNLIAYNPSTPISNAIQFGTIVMDVNNSVNKGSLQWCTDYGICNQYFIIGDSYNLGKTLQSNAVPVGFPTSAKTDTSLLITLNKIAVSEGYNPFATLSEAITWSATLGLFIENQAYPSIITTNQSLLLDAGYTASYPLVNSIWYDISGNENIGTINGATYNSTNLGNLIFDGADSITFPSVNNIPISNSSYTISVWFNPTSLGDKGLIGWGNYGSSNQTNALRLTSSGIVNYWWANDLSVTYSFTTGNWYNAVATFDGTTRSIWINGSIVGSDTPVGHNVPYSSNLTVGLTNTTEYFDGKIGVVQVFPSALTQTQITQNYNAILPRYNGTYTDPCNSAITCTPTPTTTPFVTQTLTPSPTPTQYNFDSCSSYDLYGGTTGTQFQYIICPTNDDEPVSTYVEAGNVITNICVIDSYGVYAFNGDGYYTFNGSCSVPPTPTPSSTTPQPTPSTTPYNCTQISVYPVFNDAYCTPTGDPSLIFAYNHPGNPVLYDNVYTSCSYTEIIPSGTYSNGIYVYNVSGGQIYDIQTCAGIISPTPTATRTPTPTIQLIPPTPSATPPLPTPTETPVCFGPVEPKEFKSGEYHIAGCSPVLVNPTYGNYTGIFSKLRFVNGPVANLIVYNLQGEELVNQTGQNYDNDFDFRDYNLPYGNYVISYRQCSATISSSGKVTWIPQIIGQQSRTPFSYTTTTTGNQACFDYNIPTTYTELIFTITSTSSSGPISVGDYLQTGTTVATGAAPSGTYVIGNGNKYVVNSSSIVTSVDTTTCDSLNAPNFQSFNYNRTIPNTYYQIQFPNQPLPSVGTCYTFVQEYYTNIIRIKGKVASYSIQNGGILTIANESYSCKAVTLNGGTLGSLFQWTSCGIGTVRTDELAVWVFENTQISFCSSEDSPIYMTAGDGNYFRFGYCGGARVCGGYTNPFWTSYTYNTNTGLYGCVSGF